MNSTPGTEPADEPRCPKCGGSGKAFVQVRPDARSEVVCPDCNGTGRATEALYRRLTGEAQADGDKLRDRQRFTPQPWHETEGWTGHQPRIPFPG